MIIRTWLKQGSFCFSAWQFLHQRFPVSSSTFQHHLHKIIHICFTQIFKTPQRMKQSYVKLLAFHTNTIQLICVYNQISGCGRSSEYKWNRQNRKWKWGRYMQATSHYSWENLLLWILSNVDLQLDGRPMRKLRLRWLRSNGQSF